MKKTHLYRVFEDMHLAQFLIACYMMSLILETVLVNTFRPIQYLDEATALLMGAVFLISVIWERRLDKDEAIIIVLVLGMAALGFAGNLIHGLVRSKYLWCLDAFNIFKYIAASLGAVRLFQRTKNNEYIIRYLALFAEIVIFFSTVFLIIHLNTDINMTTDVRYGFRTYNFVFKRVGDFYEACLYLLMIFFADLYVERRKVTWLFILLTMLNMASTLRSRAFIYAALFILFFIAFVILKIEKVKLRYAVPVVVAAGVAFAGQFAYYFSGDKARNVLVRYGVRTMRAYFPIGAGFGTFGTSVAQKYYSKLYFRYGFWQYYGTSMKYKAFLLDNYWPSLMAELGFFGALFMLAVILLLLRRNAKICNNPYAKICVYSCWMALLSSSAVTSSFHSGTKAMVLSALVGVFGPLVAGERCICIKKDIRKIKMSGRKRLLLIAGVLVLFCGAVLGIRFRKTIRQKLFPNTVAKTASIVTEKDKMMYDGSVDFDPFSEGVTLKNARLKDVSFRNKSVKTIREVTGERYSSLTDAEIEAVTGERVVGGRTKAEILREDPEGERTDLSVFDGVMSAEEREEILSTSEALDRTFDLSGKILQDVLTIAVSYAETGNFRDRLITYFYWTFTNSRKQAKRELRLVGYRLPAMLLPETVPTVTREMLSFEAASDGELRREYRAFADYFGVVTYNGYFDHTNEETTVELFWDPTRSQHVNIKFCHNSIYGLSVNRRIDVRVAGPEIILTESAVTIKKNAEFDPYDYVSSVRFEDGRNARGLLEVDDTVMADTPGYYTVTYSCGEESVIDMFVRVVA